MAVPMKLASGLRYGENPHQSAAFYTDSSLREHGAGGIATSIQVRPCHYTYNVGTWGMQSRRGAPLAQGATIPHQLFVYEALAQMRAIHCLQHHGKEMSYNNYLDAHAAYDAVCDLSAPSCVVVKHTNPCGVASRDDLREAYRLAVRADPISAFGGIVAFNRYPLLLLLVLFVFDRAVALPVLTARGSCIIRLCPHRANTFAYTRASWFNIHHHQTRLSGHQATALVKLSLTPWC